MDQKLLKAIIILSLFFSFKSYSLEAEQRISQAMNDISYNSAETSLDSIKPNGILINTAEKALMAGIHALFNIGKYFGNKSVNYITTKSREEAIFLKSWANETLIKLKHIEQPDNLDLPNVQLISDESGFTKYFDALRFITQIAKDYAVEQKNLLIAKFDENSNIKRAFIIIWHQVQKLPLKKYAAIFLTIYLLKRWFWDSYKTNNFFINIKTQDKQQKNSEQNISLNFTK